MIDWLIAQLRERPEVAFFVTITLGYAIGRLRIGSFTLGAVTGVLLAGVLVGQLGITLPGAIKQIFFLLFLFSIGYRTGPQFFQGLKKDGLAQAALSAIFCCVGLGFTYAAARVLGYDAGTAVGLLAGAFTESATIGTGTDAISGLAMDEVRAHRARQQDPRRIRGHLSRRRHRGGMVLVADGAAHSGRRPGGRVPDL